MPRKSGNDRDQKDINYRIIFEDSVEPKFIIDTDGVIIDANTAFATLVGRKLSDCFGLNAFSLIPSDIARERKHMIDEAIRTGRRVVFDNEFDGRMFRNSIYPIPGTDRIVDRVYIIAQDVTESKRSESRLKKESAFSKEAMEAIPGPFVVLDPRGSIVTCNSRFRKIIAKNEDDDLTGINSFDLFHPDDKAFAYEKLDSILNRGTEESEEIRIMTGGGLEYRWFRITTKRIIVDNEIFLVSTGTDITEYKNTEKHLSLDNEQLRFILSESHTGSWEWDMKTNSNKWSDEIWELYGLEKNSCIPSFENWKKTIIEEDRERIEDEVDLARKKGIPLRIEWRVRHADASLHWLMTKGIPFRDAQGIVSRYIGIVIDITDLKNARETGNKAAALNKTIIDSIPGPFYIIDENGNYAGWNAFDREVIAGKTDSEMPATRVIDTVHPEDRAHVGETIATIMKSGVDATVEGRILLRGGPEFRWFSCSGRRVVIDDHPFLIGIGTDISDRKEAELRLRENELRFRNLFENHSSIMLIVDPETDRIIDANRAASSFYGWPGDKIRRMKVGDLTTGPPDSFRTSMESVRPEKSMTFSAVHKKADGSLSNVEVTCNLSSMKESPAYYCIVNDVTDRKRAESELIENKAILETALESMSDAVFITDRKGRFIDFNDAFATFHRFSNKRECMNNIADLRKVIELSMADGTPASYDQRPVERALRGETGIAVEYGLRRRNTGEEWTGSYNFAPICDINGSITGSIVTARDITEQKKNIENLTKSEERFRRFFEEHTAVMLIIDPVKATILNANKAAVNFYGWNHEQLTGKKIYDLITLSVREIKAEMQKALQGTKNFFEFRHRRADGSVRDVEVNSNCIEIEGKILLYSIVTDVTERKKAEKALKESEERFRTLFEQHAAPMLILDPETGAIVDANFAASHYYGWKREKLIRMNVIEMNTDPPEVSRQRLAEWKHTSTRTFTVRHRKADGSIADIEIHGQKILTNGKWLAYLILHDITDRNLAEKELKILSVAIEQNPTVVVITDPQGNIEYVNPTFTNHTGYTFEEAKGQNPRILKSGLMPREFYENLWNTILSGKVWHGEFHNRKKNGELHWEDAYISAIRNEKGEITNFVAVKEDITEKKKLWNELVISRDKAEESDRLKTAFLSNISHEIRTPMNGILGFAELLREPLLTGEEQQEYIGLIQQSGERMMKLITDIIEISRIDANVAATELSETPLNSLLENLYHVFRREAESKGLELNWKAGLSNSESIIETDSAKLQLIMSNLLQNALKFTHEGHVDFGYDKKDGLLEFYVVDSGIGVPDEMKEKIFERFSQVDNSLSRLHEGAGLGLSITKAYIELLGGIIHVEPCSCGGSRFFFTLPYTPTRNVEPGETGSLIRSASRRLTIVIAEDDEVSSLLLNKALKNENFRIFSAQNGREAVELVRQHPETDIVLMDIKMPLMNGYEATRLVKEMRPGLPVIAQTAFASPEDREKALYAGCDGFLTKPVKKSELLDMIRTLTR
jgi:PAS domain S-box-containing protein